MPGMAASQSTAAACPKAVSRAPHVPVEKPVHSDLQGRLKPGAAAVTGKYVLAQTSVFNATCKSGTQRAFESGAKKVPSERCLVFLVRVSER
jgi:hypothetical protein